MFQLEHIVTYIHFSTKVVAVSGQSKFLCIYTHQDPLKHLLGLVLNCVVQGWIYRARKRGVLFCAVKVPCLFLSHTHLIINTLLLKHR